MSRYQPSLNARKARRRWDPPAGSGRVAPPPPTGTHRGARSEDPSYARSCSQPAGPGFIRLPRTNLPNTTTYFLSSRALFPRRPRTMAATCSRGFIVNSRSRPGRAVFDGTHVAGRPARSRHCDRAAPQDGHSRTDPNGTRGRCGLWPPRKVGRLLPAQIRIATDVSSGFRSTSTWPRRPRGVRAFLEALPPSVRLSRHARVT